MPRPPHPQRDVVLGLIAQGQTHPEIAAALRIPRATVASIARLAGEQVGRGRRRNETLRAEVTRLRASGMSWRAIGLELGVSRSTAAYLVTDGERKK